MALVDAIDVPTPGLRYRAHWADVLNICAGGSGGRDEARGRGLSSRCGVVKREVVADPANKVWLDRLANRPFA